MANPTLKSHVKVIFMKLGCMDRNVKSSYIVNKENSYLIKCLIQGMSMTRKLWDSGP